MLDPEEYKKLTILTQFINLIQENFKLFIRYYKLIFANEINIEKNNIDEKE